MDNKKIVSILYILFNYCFLFSQCISDGPRSPFTILNDTSIGTVGWNNLNNAINSDNTRADASDFVGALSTKTTNYINASNFGFNIPTNANVCGIEITVERRGQGIVVGSSIQDNSVRIIKEGLITGNNNADGNNWTTNDQIITYGSNTEDWGTTWSPANINSTAFGISLGSVNLNSGTAAVFLAAEIDHIEATVYYEIPLPVELSSFNAERKNNFRVDINWATSSEINNDYFVIERSIDIVNWEKRERVSGNGNSNTTNYYTFTDINNLDVTSYYRLKQIDFNGAYTYSKTLSIEPINNKNNFSIYPNPSSGLLKIDSKVEYEKIEIINLCGEIVFSSNIITKELNLNTLKKGHYVVKAYSNKNVYIEKLLIN